MSGDSKGSEAFKVPKFHQQSGNDAYNEPEWSVGPLAPRIVPTT